MSDAPKIVKDRLRAAAPREVHPEADMLTAFAEQALSGTEREGVMRHLARCGDCREVVALSIPPTVDARTQTEVAAETSARQGSGAERAWFGWPQLRWAAMAAGVAFVASVLILRPEKQSETTTAVAPQAPSLHSQPPASPSRDKSLASSAIEQAQPGAIKSDHDASTPREEKHVADQATPARGLTSRQTRSAVPAAIARAHELDSTEAKPESGPVAGPLAVPAASTEASGFGRTTAYQANGVNGAPSEALSTAELIARNDAPARPIQKTKDADKEESQLKSTVPGNKLAGSSMAATELDSNLARAKKQSKLSKNAIPQWSLVQGRLQRSLDAGATWQMVLQLDQPLLCYRPIGNEVWAGGQGGVLAHSIDGGAAWTMVHPSTKAEPLTADIVAIEVRSATEIVLSTSGHASWSTADAGATWEEIGSGR